MSTLDTVETDWVIERLEDLDMNRTVKVIRNLVAENERLTGLFKTDYVPTETIELCEYAHCPCRPGLPNHEPN